MSGIPSKLRTPKGFFLRIDSHYRLLFSLLVAGGAFFIFKGESVPATILTTWIGFALSVIILEWVVFFGAHPREIRKIASIEDSSRTLIFIITLCSALISLSAIYILLKSTKGHSDEEVAAHVFLALGAVITSWWLVHTIFTMRYAHVYYDIKEKDHTHGLQFPDEELPDYIDFVYFSFVIGMTFQVSDVEISSRRIRRLALVHSLVSFVFNTAIVALSINIVSGLVSN
ncbi:DUF1345 domain-containing protein [Mucilaginibacter sp. JRF]|uniref:DUF1345 domain-containing protein n=1 Tax=Mucilaginibacter sp. JRF TaxID=2780088 RepID=UPI00187FD868|nr:DUF1345 domain-containing protein [Mucilaginibacter sp. JRF]MBE9584362.1 DUF1345 domain-containing protein [Mucilaginibacter sp. JRF]